MPRRRKASAASPPWADLLPELLREIYGRLIYAADPGRFPAVCKPWHNAVAADRPLPCPPWADLPVEALLNIAVRLHVASDLVRFYAVCWNWKIALDGDPPNHWLLPWLLAPPSTTGDEAEEQRCRCVFSKATYRTPGVCFRDRRVVAYADGTVAWLFGDKKEISLVNPLTADPRTLLAGGRLSDRWLDWQHRIVSGDHSCVLLYDFHPHRRFRASLLHPDLGNKWFYLSSHLSTTDRCCAAAYHHGGYVVCVDLANCYVLRPNPDQQEEEDEYNCFNDTTREVRAVLPDEPNGRVRQGSYLLNYHGQLLLASVLRDRQGGGRLSVTLHELRLNGGEEPEVEWVRREQSDSDVSLLEQGLLFLGFPNSFVVAAVDFGGQVSGGFTYFIIEDNLASGQGHPVLPAMKSCGVYRYRFRDGVTTLVERLPPGWHDARCMWFLPDPQILARYPLEDGSEPAVSSICSNGSGTRRHELRIYAGDLSSRVDNSRLREMFSVYGKVASTRIAYDKRGRSRGFGFVTMATQEGFDKAMAPPKAVEEPVGNRSVISDFFDLLVLILLIAALVYILQWLVWLAVRGFSFLRNIAMI
ncbi:unnamed protein product [Urochloa humidicola]